MSDFLLTLVLQSKRSKIINDMAKVQQISEKITAFGGIFFVLDKFDRILSSVIDSHLGLRSRLIGYQSARLYGPCSPVNAAVANATTTVYPRVSPYLMVSSSKRMEMHKTARTHYQHTI